MTTQTAEGTHAQTAALVEAMRALVRVVGQLPENGRGTIQGEDLNRAYMDASGLLDRLDALDTGARTAQAYVDEN